MLFDITVDYLTRKKTITFEREMIHVEIYKDLKQTHKKTSIPV